MEQRGTDNTDRGQQLAELLGEMLGLNSAGEGSVPPADDESVITEKLPAELEAEWLSVKAACEYVHVSRTTLYRLVREGKLPSHRVRSRILLNREKLDQCIADGLLA